MRRRWAFSLIELVIVLVITGVLAIMASTLIRRPIEGQRDLVRRARLVDLAGQSLGRMSRELRLAVPNTVRITGGGSTMELLVGRDGGRYRRAPGINDPGGPNEVDHTADSDWQSFGDDSEFNVITRFAHLAFSYGAPLPSGTRLAIYPTGTSLYSEAASNSSPARITPDSLSITITDDGDEEHIVLSAPHRFSLESPSQRIYVVEGPVTYHCDPAAGTLTRYDAYAITSTQPSDPGSSPLSGGNSALVVDQVERCAFSYTPGTPERAGLVTIALAISEQGERVSLLQQIHVENAP